MFMPNPPKFYSTDSGNLNQELMELSQESPQDSKLQAVFIEKTKFIPQQSNLLEPSLVDLNWLSCQPLLPFLVPLMPAHLLYRSLVAHGFEDSLEVIEWVRGEQLQKILDFDLWEKSHQFEVEDISTNKFLSWIQAWLAIDLTFAANRFLELEEETICLILSQIFEILPEGVSHISEDVRENWWLTIDNRFFLRIRENGEESFEILKQFVDALYAHDIRLAGSLFAYSCMLIRQETLEKGLRWRASRIADQGFISMDEARRVLAPKKIVDLKKTIEETKALEVKKSKQENMYRNFISTGTRENDEIFTDTPLSPQTNFSPEEFDSLVKLLTSFEPEEGVKYINLALGQAKLKSLTGESRVPAEQFYADEDFINEASENILNISKNILLNLEFRSSSKEEASLIIEKAILHMAEADKGKLASLKESISYLANCINSGMEFGFNYNNIKNSSLITRGTINIGLELCLKMPAEYGLSFNQNDVILNAVNCINVLGINFLFHLGWNLLFKIKTNLAEKLMDLDLNDNHWHGKLNTLQLIKLSDNSTIPVSLSKLIASSRFVDTEKWLSSFENIFSNELFFTLKALLDRVSLYPKTFDGASQYVTTKTRPFETLADIDTAFNFISNLAHNLEQIKN